MNPNTQQPTNPSASQTLKERAYKEANEDRAKQFATMAGASAAVLGGEKLLQRHLHNKMRDSSKELTGRIVDTFSKKTLMPEDDPTVRRASKLRSISNFASSAKGLARLGLAAGLGGYAIDKATKHFDGGEGIFDKKYTQGERDNYLVGAGAAALIPAYGLAYYLGRKTQKAVMKDGAMKRIANGEQLSPKDVFDDNLVSTGKAVDSLGKARTAKEYMQNREQLAEKGKEAIKEAVEKGGLSRRDLKLLNLSAGAQEAGATSMGIGLMGMTGNSAYARKLAELEEEQEEKKQQKLLKKKSSLGVAAGIHLLQAQLYKAIAEGKIGKKQAAKYLTDRFTEGYTGEAVKPTGKAKLIPQRVRDFLHGAGKQIMPEADIIGKEVTEMGKKLRDGGIDLGSLAAEDKKFLKEVAAGDLVSAAKTGHTAPMAQDILEIAMPNLSRQQSSAILGESSFHASNNGLLEDLSRQFKKTRTQPILQSISEHIEKNKGLPATSGRLKDATKARELGYNVGHGALAVADPATAVLNGVKRYATGEKMKGEGLAPAVYNGGQKALQILTTTIPTLKSKIKGLAGSDYNPSVTDRVLKNVWSPAIEHTKEDSQRFAKMQRTIAMNTAGPEAEAKLNKARDSATKVIGDYSGLSGIKKATKGLSEAKKGLSKEDKEDILNTIKGSMQSRSKDRHKAKQGRELMEKSLRRATGNHKEGVQNALMAGINKGDRMANKAAEEMTKIEERYKRWMAPSILGTTAAIGYPMMSSYKDRVQKENAKNQPSKLRKQPMAA